MTDAPRSHGRKAIRATGVPRALIDGPPELAGVWQARVITLFPEAFPGHAGPVAYRSGARPGAVAAARL
jgi:tRNA (guanine37-N1)-methyltransferase